MAIAGAAVQSPPLAIQVAGRKIDVGDALRGRIGLEMAQVVEKFFGRATEGAVTVSREGHGFEVDCLVRLPSGITLQAQGFGSDAHAAFAQSLEKLEKRIKRYKRRLRNHHNAHKQPLPAEAASAFILQPPAEDDAVDDGGGGHSNAGHGEAEDGSGRLGDFVPETEPGPAIVAETTVQVTTMTVGMAVLQLEVTDAPALLFRNAAHGGLNMVYRRPDGNIGWVNPK